MGRGTRFGLRYIAPSRAHMALWERRPREIHPEVVKEPLPGPTTKEIFGYSEDGRLISPTRFSTTLTSFGNTTRPPINGHGWVAAIRELGAPASGMSIFGTTRVASRGYTGPSGRRLPRTFREAGPPLQNGRTAKVTCGSSVAADSTPMATLAIPTTSGNSIPPLPNGPGWVETT